MLRASSVLTRPTWDVAQEYDAPPFLATGETPHGVMPDPAGLPVPVAPRCTPRGGAAEPGPAGVLCRGRVRGTLATRGVQAVTPSRAVRRQVRDPLLAALGSGRGVAR